MSDETLFLVCMVAAVCAAVWAVWWLVSGRSVIDQRLNPATPAEGGLWGRSGAAEASGLPDLSQLLQRVGQTVGKPLQPRSEEDQSDLKRRLSYAGMYSRPAMSAFVGARILLLLVGLIGGALAGMAIFGDKNAMMVLVLALGGGMAGYLGPTFWLDWRIRKIQLKMEHALPDMLDLLVVCVESGLTMDAAFQRVGREIALSHPGMARELAMAHLETQMGVPRTEALRNIYRRTGSQAVQSLTAMLIQADRFGTSIAEALRIYSDSLRQKRRFKAEEQASKAAVKITFPLVLCIFPALLIVIGAPAVLRIRESGLFN